MATMPIAAAESALAATAWLRSWGNETGEDNGDTGTRLDRPVVEPERHVARKYAECRDRIRCVRNPQGDAGEGENQQWPVHADPYVERRNTARNCGPHAKSGDDSRRDRRSPGEQQKWRVVRKC